MARNATSPRSKKDTNQNWRTPPEFLHAVERRFGPIDFDLCATTGHQVAPSFFSPEQNALNYDWRTVEYRNGYCNPPFSNIEEFMSKAEETRLQPRWTTLLVPASIDTVWYRSLVLNRAMVFGIPRMKFVGADAGYPKALMFVCFGFGVSGHGYWNWRKE